MNSKHKFEVVFSNVVFVLAGSGTDDNDADVEVVEDMDDVALIEVVADSDEVALNEDEVETEDVALADDMADTDDVGDPDADSDTEGVIEVVPLGITMQRHMGQPSLYS